MSCAWYNVPQRKDGSPCTPILKFKRAFVYTGSIGEFRYRFANDKENNLLHAAVYTHFCYERAEDVQERDFSWDDAGVAQLKAWLQEQLEAHSAGKNTP